MLTGLPAAFQHQGFLAMLLKWGNLLPLFQAGFGWVLPALLGFLVGALADHRHHRNVLN
jgi:LIVCS family branched-chain amino acid:cation transporter